MVPCEMTVVATVYNQPLADIEKTLASIAAQKGCEYELLVGDDIRAKTRARRLKLCATNLASNIIG